MNKKFISLISAAALSAQIFMSVPVFAAQTIFSDDLSSECGYVAGDVIDTTVTNFLAVAQTYFPSGAILSWNNPDDEDAEEIKLFKNGVRIEEDAEWDYSAGAFNKIGVDAFANSDVFTLKLKKGGVEKTYKAQKLSASSSAGDWSFMGRDGWQSNSEPTNYYANGGAFIDTSVGYNSSASLKLVSNRFQPTRSGNDENNNENVSNDANIQATWAIPANQGKLENGRTYEIRYKIKTVNAGRMYLFCNDANRWDAKPNNQHIARNSDWVTKSRNFVKSDGVTSFTFTIPLKTDAIWIDDVEIGYIDGDEFVTLIKENFEVNSSDYEPSSFFMAPGAGVRSVSWVNPNVSGIEKIEIYRVEESGETLLSDDFNTAAGARQDFEVLSDIRCVKGVFYFENGKVIQMFAATDNPTLWGNHINEWIFGLNQQGSFKYNPAICVVDEDESATDDGTASLKYIANTQTKRDKTFITAANNGFTVEEGKVYEVTMMIKAEGNVEGIKANIGGGGLFDGYTSNGVSGTDGNYDWKQLEFKYTAVSSGKKSVGIEIPYATKGFWIDDLEAYELDEDGERVSENLIVNGDISDYEYPTGSFSALKAVGGDRSATISWKNGDGYQSIQLYQKSGDEWFYRGSVPNTLPGITFTGLERETEYTYKLIPITAFGVKGEAETVSVETLMLDYEMTEPEISDGALAIGENTITMTVKNNKQDKPLAIELLVGIYKDGVLRDVKHSSASVEMTAPSEDATSLEVKFNIDDDGEYEVRVMVIDSRKKLNSYFDMYTLTLAE